MELMVALWLILLMSGPRALYLRIAHLGDGF